MKRPVKKKPVMKKRKKRLVKKCPWRLRVGDSLDVMRGMLDESVTAVVTDPPYGLAFMGKEWDHGVPGVAYWEEALRVTKPGGMLLAFGGTRTHHRLMCAIEDAGWELRDCLSWMYGTGFPKSLDVSKAIDKAAGATDAAKLWEGYGTALKPSWEPIILAMKPLDGTYAVNAQERGVAGLNVDGCRIATTDTWAPSTRGPSDSIGTFKTNTRTTEQHAEGRWPTNVILDAEAGVLLDEQVGEDKSRFFYCAKATKKDRTMGGRVENSHPTVKPTDLMRWLIRLVKMPKGSVVLDPFAGSGSTGVAALLEGVRCLLIEQDEESAETIRERLRIAIQER